VIEFQIFFNDERGCVAICCSGVVGKPAGNGKDEGRNWTEEDLTAA